jgi:integrase
VTEVSGRLVWTTTKTYKSRSVPVPAFLIPSLVDVCRGRGPEDPVFTAPDGGPLRLRNWRARVFDPAFRAAGITCITPHDLQHTAASLASAAGANVKAVQRMLGHASAAMTLDICAGLFPDDLDSVAASLDLVARAAAGAAALHLRDSEVASGDDGDASTGAQPA